MRPSLAFYNTIAEVDLLVAIRHMPKPDRATALRNLAIAFEHYNEEHPHSALKYRSPREFRRLVEAST